MQSPDRRPKRVQGVLLAVLSCLVTAMPCLAQSAAGKSQLIWFAPRDSTDYIDLFNPSSPWTQAASHVQIFKFYNVQFLTHDIPNPLTDDQLRQALADLKRRKILLAVETGVLTDPADSSCGYVEGFYGEQTLDLANRIKALGGTLDYFAMDGPLRSGRGSCNWTPQQSAENAAQNIAMLRTVFPNVKVGDIESPPDTRVPDSLTQLAVWLDAWRAAAGEPLAFLHADVDWEQDYQPALEAMRQVAEQRQIPFGIIYNGLPSDQSDQDWVNHARSHYESVEAAGLIPDHVIFQSWDPYPKHVLPESDPTTFTHLINTYFPTTTAVEYYYAAWNYYFETAFPDEIAGLDGGAYGGVWQRTGQTFNVWPQQTSLLAFQTCRFFSTSFAPKSSHFYTPDPGECEVVKTNPNWEFESIAFYIQLRDASGNCPPGTIPLYRMYNNGMGGAPNHRYTTSLAILDQMIAAGWVFEGNGVTKVFACVPQ